MKRLSISKGAKKKSDKRPELASKLPKTGNAYNNFKNATSRLCDDMLQTDLKSEQKQKVAWLRSRIEIEM